MAAVRALAVFALASVCEGLQVQDITQHNLTVCNAYAETKPLSVYTLNNKAKLTEEPLQYKACKEISLELAENERIDFKLGGLSVGTFHVTGLPYTATSLLLVPYRKGNGTMAATFYSHAFSSATEQAQLAVVDAYDGSSTGVFKIGQGHKRQTQDAAVLKAGSVVSLAPGAYQVSLEDASGKRVKTMALRADGGSKNIFMRVGSSDGLPQELVAFPGDSSARSGSLRSGVALSAAAAALAALFA